MTKNFIAITKTGTEFLFNRSSMIAVPAASAEKIAAALNNVNYRIKAGEKWHVYENDYYLNGYITNQIKAFRNGKIRISYNSYYG